MDALQRIMSSFKQFERKLDKLQDDVSYHGQTLNDLRTLVASLSAGTIANPDLRPEEPKRSQRKSTAIQYDNFVEPIVVKTRRKNAIQAFPAKIKARSFQSQGSRMYEVPFLSKLNASPKGSPAKRSHKSLRPCKAEAPRKATMLRTGKNTEKKRSKIQKSQIPVPVNLE